MAGNASLRIRSMPERWSMTKTSILGSEFGRKKITGGPTTRIET